MKKYFFASACRVRTIKTKNDRAATFLTSPLVLIQKGKNARLGRE